MDTRIVASVIIGMAVFFLLHVGIWRMAPSNVPRMFLLGRLAAMSVAVSLLAEWLWGGFDAVALCTVLWIDAFWITLYFFIYAGLVRSVSLTLLSRMVQCGDRPIRGPPFDGLRRLARDHAG